MFFAFIYDHEYVKSDQDFYGDAIISFYPAEYKDKYIYLLGQIIGTINFMKGTFSSTPNQFKLDSLIIQFKPFSSQFLLTVATDNVANLKDVLLKNNLNLLFNLIRCVNGPIIHKDRIDNEQSYAEFRQRLSEITSECFSLVFKSKKLTFNSYYTSSPFNLRIALEARCKQLMEYAIKKFKALNGVIFYENRIFYSKIKNQSILNLLHFLNNSEEKNLLEKCLPLDASLVLPSKCYLVKATLSGSLYKSLINGSIDTKFDKKLVTDEDDSSEDQGPGLEELSNLEDTDIIMDKLPESTRFTQYMSFNDLISKNLSALNDEFDEDDCDNDDMNKTCDLIIYTQNNSRLKIILFISDEISEDLTNVDSIIKNWQRIVNYFSNMEYELSNEKDRIAVTNPTVGTSLNSVNFAKLTSADLINNKNVERPTTNSFYSCVIDSYRIIKPNTNQIFGSTSSGSNGVLRNQIQTLTLTSEIISNMNLFYELIDSMPELSKLQISKKGHCYNFLKQNVVTMASSTLVENELSKSKSDRKHSQISNFEALNEINTPQRKRSSPELVPNKSLNKGQNNLLKGLQYGEILFRCTSSE